MTESIIYAVESMNNYLKGIVTVKIDSEMIRKYPDNYAKLGYLGVTLLVSCNNKETRVFLKNQQAEDMMVYPNMIEDFLLPLIREDLEYIIKQGDRKKKLEKIDELK